MHRVMSLLVVLILSTAISAGAQGIKVTIDSPVDGARVPLRPCFEGMVSNPASQVWLVVHPLEVADFWVQPSASVREGGKWKVQGYIGRQGLDEGKQFEIRAVANPKIPLRETQKDPLPAWPPAEASSPIVEVTREDGASSGCGEAKSSTTIAPSQEIVVLQPPLGVQRTTGKVGDLDGRSVDNRMSAKRAEFQMRAVYIALLVVSILFILLPARTNSAGNVLKPAWEVVRAMWNHIVYVSGPMTKSATNIGGRVTEACQWCRSQSSAVWEKRSSCGLFIGKLILGVLLLLISLFATYVDSRAIHSALQLVFGVSASSVSVEPGLIGSIYALDIVENGNEVQKSTDSSLRKTMIQPFLVLLNQNLGSMAIGLAAILAGMGLVLFAGKRGSSPTELSRSAVAEAHFPLLFFLLMNISFAVLAGLRTYELAIEAGSLRSVYACIIGACTLALPWFAAFSVHLAIEFAEDVLGVVETGPVSILMLVLSGFLEVLLFALKVTVRILLILGILIPMAIIAVGYSVLRLYLYFMLLINEAFKELFAAVDNLRNSTYSGPRSGVPQTTLYVIAAVMAGTIILLLSGCSPQPATVAAVNDGKGFPKGEISMQSSAVDYAAWVYCVDISTSPQPDQFAKGKGVIQKSAETDIKNNDAVWLIEVGEQPLTARSFTMPPAADKNGVRPIAPEQRMKAAADLKKDLMPLVDTIRTLKQTSSVTNLNDVIARALGILKDQRVREKSLVISSDYVNDLENNHLAAEPPPFDEKISAEGVAVTLLLTLPKQEYLRKLGMSETELERVVRQDWVQYFKNLKSASVAVKLVDSFPAADRE